MKRRQFVIGAAAIVGGGGLLGNTAGVTTSTVERPVTIDVVEDDEALLRLVYDDRMELTGSSPYESVELVEIGNLFGSELTVEEFWIEYPDDEITVSELAYPSSLSVGESESVTMTVECSNAEPTTMSLEFGVDVSGTNVSASVSNRSIELELECASS